MELDVRGEICPYPQVKTVAALKKLAPSDELEVLTDHPPALETVPAQAARLGYVAEIKELGTAEWCIVLRKGRQHIAESGAAWYDAVPWRPKGVQ